MQELRTTRGTWQQALIASEDISHVARWQFGSVGPDTGEPEAGISDPQALREAHAAGHAEGFAAGRAQALAEAQAEFAAFRAHEGLEIAGRLDALLRAAEAGLAEAQQEIARGTLEIACALARQVLRRELAIDPKALEPVVHEALSLLLADGRSATVRLAPADFDVLDEALRARFAGQSVSVVADAAVNPGDCLVESAGAVVDGSVATRWTRAVAGLGLALPWNEEHRDVR
ncbi:flagellar assembly protein FliH [Variovorax sp. J22P168]|uniref:FliH/SctL family protein n=1 Tax=Variovorax jilinensis TaxID=3053513 RepID=UPI002577D962|nr:flagellar assembly protein FliH [Variovorax sp. J22P168]MDM0014769.1 flagellar assembly protein FliH [Variovorax sp. J22P168]